MKATRQCNDSGHTYVQHWTCVLEDSYRQLQTLAWWQSPVDNNQRCIPFTFPRQQSAFYDRGCRSHRRIINQFCTLLLTSLSSQWRTPALQPYCLHFHVFPTLTTLCSYHLPCCTEHLDLKRRMSSCQLCIAWNGVDVVFSSVATFMATEVSAASYRA